MNRAELIDKVRSATDTTRTEAEAAVDAVLQSVMVAVKAGDRVSLFGFGAFTPTSRSARLGRNPRTGDPVKIAASSGVRFAPAAAFKASLNPKKTAKKATKAAPVAKATKAAPVKKAATKAATATKKR
ncbi:MAG: HU family DNA-binding protein [Acidimicrobiales bacterium]